MSQNGPLKTYRAKRNFKKTAEPQAKKLKRTPKTKAPIFVIQRHEATRTHYDLRLEITGVLKSWAVPKGPSLDPAVKRLAVETEDHPMEYAQFEGVIPVGNYGAGPVMIWDYGTFENIKKDSLKKCYGQGHIEFLLHGKKLIGTFALIRTHLSESKPAWLLVKMKDEYASATKNPVKSKTKSAKTGRTMKQISKEG
ncbi:hypothetical protein Noda2021_10090 [Candidatus Dependentiae bacterium Noda2021]|nr:hypothetical protein Noda2021_10090 [Candidatus Dependentiae bacterium Noda2021]